MDNQRKASVIALDLVLPAHSGSDTVPAAAACKVVFSLDAIERLVGVERPVPKAGAGGMSE